MRFLIDLGLSALLDLPAYVLLPVNFVLLLDRYPLVEEFLPALRRVYHRFSLRQQ